MGRGGFSHHIQQLPADLVAGLAVTAAAPLRGGQIAHAFRLETARGLLFLKTHPEPLPGMFEREATGLRALRKADTLPVPAVVRESSAGLVLEWVEVGPRTTAADVQLGRGLAGLHRTTGMAFGGLDADTGGYLGSQPVDLTPTTSWAEFYVERRLRPLTRRAVECGRLDPMALDLVDRVASNGADRCGPVEPPTLVHGDLWGGNRLVDRRGASWLIDPAAHWGHREADLAMMRLFGGFGEASFTAYEEVFPLAAGWQQRVEWYQLQTRRSAADPGRVCGRQTSSSMTRCSSRAGTPATSWTATGTGGTRRSSLTWTPGGTTFTWPSRTGGTTSTSAR